MRQNHPEYNLPDFKTALSLLLFPAILGDRTLFFIFAGLVAVTGFFHIKTRPKFSLWLLPLFFLLLTILSNLLWKNVPGPLLERKINFLWIPILVWISGIKPDRYCLQFIEISCGIFSFLLIFNGLLNFFFLQNLEFISYHGFADNFKYNAIYLSAYLCLGYFSAIQRGLVNQEKFDWNDHLFLAATFISLVLLSSKLILCLCLFLPFAYIWINKSGKNLKWISSGLLVVSLVLFSVLPVGKRFGFEIRETYKILELSHFNPSTYFTGTSIRLVLNKFSFEIIKEEKQYLFGLGMGNLQEKLNAKIVASGMYTGETGKPGTGFLGYNTHNQYVHTLAESGILGLFGLISLLTYMLMKSFRSRNFLFIFQTVLFIFLGLTENYMEVYFKGTLLFAFVFGMITCQEKKPMDKPIS